MSQIAKIVSVSQVIILIACALFSIIKLNTYTSMITSLLIFKSAPTILIKKLTQKIMITCLKGRCNNIENFLSKASKRPKEAFNCNSWNKGGANKRSGIISGHCVSTSLLFTIVLFEVIDRKAKKQKCPMTLLILLLILTLMMPFSRVALNCHTYTQTIVGNIVGVVLGICFVYIEKKYITNSSRYSEDKKKFYDMMSEI